MLFNSFEFIFGFLPITLYVFFRLSKNKQEGQYRVPIIWLVLASLFFYSWWDYHYLILLVLSTTINYSIGTIISGQHQIGISKKLALFIGVALNIGVIAYYKYSNFFLDTVNSVVGSNWHLDDVILPLGISFFTFEQIAFLVDIYKGKSRENNLINYFLFVTFFPRLIAGPIILHQDTIPQFEQESVYRFNSQNFAIGLTVFMGGLFKKIVFADRISEFANAAFNAAGQGVPLTFSEAWVGALAYTVQLYFDFSGYSDMAIGAAYMFNIRLPINFNSPYKAISIIDFWRRWHITLSNFLRDYLYISLGGNRQGEIRRNFNLLMTMLLGGLWHGAAWTFVVWGGLHGTYLVINHQYRSIRKKLGHDLNKDNWFLQGMGWLVTFLAVVVSWVIFRAKDLPTAQSMLAAMIGLNGIQLPGFLEPQLQFLRSLGVGFSGFTVNVGISQKYAVFGTIILLIVAWCTPNTQEWMGKYSPALINTKPNNNPSKIERFWQKYSWQPNRLWTTVVAVLTAASLLCFTRVSEFLYFQF